MVTDNNFKQAGNDNSPSLGHGDRPVPKAPFPTNDDAETTSAEKPPKGDPPFKGLRDKTQDDAASTDGTNHENSDQTKTTATAPETKTDPQVQPAGDDSTVSETKDTDGQIVPERVEAQPKDNGESKKTEGKDDSDDSETTVKPSAKGDQQGHNDDGNDSNDACNDKDDKKSGDSPKKSKPKKKKSNIKRSLKDDALDEAIDKTTEAMRSIETGGKIKLSTICKLCSCSETPATKVYGQALRKIKRYIELDDSESSKIAHPNVNQRGANIPPSFLNDLFDDFEGTHPYQKGVELNCVRINEVDLLISIKPEKGENDA